MDATKKVVFATLSVVVVVLLLLLLFLLVVVLVIFLLVVVLVIFLLVVVVVLVLVLVLLLVVVVVVVVALMFHFPLFTRLSSTLTESISLEGMEIVGLWITLFGNNCNLRRTIFFYMVQ